MKTPYRFTKKKSKPYIYVTFAHIPGRWFSTGTANMSEAVLFAENKLKEVFGGQRDLTLNEFAQDFFTEKDPHNYRHRLERRDTHYEEIYFEQHQQRLDKYILKAHGSYLLSSLKDTFIEDFIIDIPKLANSTKNKILACYRIVLDEAVREGYIPSNPAKTIKDLPENNKPREPFTAEELEKLFPEDDQQLIDLWGGENHSFGLKYAVYFLIERDTGWRPSEVSALKSDNYFEDLHGIYTAVDINWRTHTLSNHIKTTKKGQKFKNGFLSEQTERLLKALISESSSEYIFLLSGRYKVDSQGTNRFIYPENANKRLREVCRIAKVELGDRTQYSFRHTFNTNAIGVLPESARLLLMGHRRNRPEYDHLSPEETLKRAKSLIDEKKATS